MLIWRNLDPKILAQLLVQASAVWKARHTPHKRGERASGHSRPVTPLRVHREDAGDV